MTTPDILNCPHCGGGGYLMRNCGRGRYGSRLYYVMVRCNLCGAQGKIYSDEEDPADNDWNDQACVNAVKAWNMRYHPDKEN